jgi:hypothetical protein
MRGMKSPLIPLFTRDGDSAQSIREALFGAGAIVLTARDVRDEVKVVCGKFAEQIPSNSVNSATSPLR